jgi:hypothetical protein
MQPNQTRLMPVYSSGPMQPRQDVQSFDLTRNSGPSRSLVTGDRRLTRNPNGRMGAPQMDAMGERIGSRGMTPLRRMEIAARRGDMRANELLFRAQAGLGGMGMGGMAPRGYGQPQAAPQGYGQPAPGMPANNNQPLPAPLDPLANLPPPATTEQALGMLGYGPTAAAEANTEQPLLPPLNLPWTGQPLPGGVPMGQLPPSTMNGATGVPPPPAYSMQQVGGFNVLTGPDGKGGSKFLNAYTDPNRGGPTPLSAGEMGRIRAAGYAPAEVGGRSFDAQGVPYLQPLPPVPVPTERVTEGPTGTTRTYTQPRGTQASPPAGEGGSNYFDSLLPAAPTASTQTGQMPVTPTASTQTGQMPNVAYAAPMRSEPPQASTQNGEMSLDTIYETYHPEMILESARQEYARTGDDSGIREHVRRFPSESTRLSQEETQIWQQIGQEMVDHSAAQQAQMDAFNEREKYIQENAFGVMGAGAAARDWEAQNPAKAAIMSRPLPVRDRTLIAQANRKNAQFWAAHQGLPVPADWADDPGRVPALPPLPLPTPQRPFWQSVGMGASAMGNDLAQMPGRLADYGRKNPLLTIRR